jgi:hypothetical protein
LGNGAGNFAISLSTPRGLQKGTEPIAMKLTVNIARRSMRARVAIATDTTSQIGALVAVTTFGFASSR